MNLFQEIKRLQGGESSMEAFAQACGVSRRKLYDFDRPELVSKMKLSTVQAVLGQVNRLRADAGEPAIELAKVV